MLPYHESSTQSSGSNLQAKIAERRIDFIAVRSDESFYPKTDQKGKQIGSIGYKFEKYFYKGWFTREVIDIVYGKKENYAK